MLGHAVRSAGAVCVVTFLRHHFLQPAGGHSLGSPTRPGSILDKHSSNVDGSGVHLLEGETEGDRL